MDSWGSLDTGISTQEALGLAELFVHLARCQQVRPLARTLCVELKQLLGCDGVTMVLSEDAHVYYAESEAIGPLWKGQRYEAASCISGWAILHRQPAIVEDVYNDERITPEWYRPTFVNALVTVPIGDEKPIGAIGAYWAEKHKVTPKELFIMRATAEATAAALCHAEFHEELETMRAGPKG
ncbi:MAG: GAF domain-containing protein [Myxococcota bacterium]